MPGESLVSAEQQVRSEAVEGLNPDSSERGVPWLKEQRGAIDMNSRYFRRQLRQYQSRNAMHATVPDGMGNVEALAASDRYWLALSGDGPPLVKTPLVHPEWTTNGFGVSLPTQSGRVHALEYKQNVQDPLWTALPLVAGAGHERTLTDPSPAGSQRFYRVRRW